MMFFSIILLNIFLISKSLAATCLPPPDANAECVSVSNYGNLLQIIASTPTNRDLIFCPFHIKADNRRVDIYKKLNIQCQSIGKCTIQGGSAVIGMNSYSDVMLQGFVFTRGSMWTIQILQSSHTNAICDCHFLNNRNKRAHERGAAMRLDQGSKALVENCVFENNYVNGRGAGIFTWGQVDIRNSVFKENEAEWSGSAIGGYESAVIYLEGNRFEGNKEDMLLIHTGTQLHDAGGNIAANNYGCNGVRMMNGACIDFKEVDQSSEPTTIPSTTSFPSDVPTAIPSRAPSIEPTFLPSSGPSSKPSFFPSNVPTSKPTDFVPDLSPGSCQKNIPDSFSCYTVETWSQLRTMIETADEMFIFLCPFNLSKPEDESPIVIESIYPFLISCAQNDACRISGGDTYFIIGDPLKLSKVEHISIQGFVLEGSTKSAVVISHGTSGTQTLCYNTFLRGNSNARGGGIFTYDGTEAYVISCKFENNTSTDYGASIYSNGVLHIYDSTFTNNTGAGSVLTVSNSGFVYFRNSLFDSNDGGSYGAPLLFLKDNYYDLGGNIATNNHGCDGIYNFAESERCKSFSTTMTPTNHPTIATPMNTEGYFNYDPTDELYGPSNWSNILENTEEKKRWSELHQYMPQHDLHNECSGGDTATWKQQSPVDVCNSSVVDACIAGHQIRGFAGNLGLQRNPDKVDIQILPNKLRIKYEARSKGPLIYNDEKTTEEYTSTLQPPNADFPTYWNENVQTQHVDIKIPSEHTMCGEQFDAELSIWHLHPEPEDTWRKGQDIIAMSVLVKIGAFNFHFHKALLAFRNKFLADAEECCLKRLNQTDLDSVVPESFCDNHSRRLREHFDVEEYEENEEDLDGPGERNLAELMEGWNPYDTEEIVKSIYYFGYHGSMTEPPCSTMVAWRIISEPMTISEQQFLAMKYMLMEHRSADTCHRTSVDWNGMAARPVQEKVSTEPMHGLYQCTRDNFVSDREKVYMRKVTGDPHWCC